jgi:hypothetical protein
VYQVRRSRIILNRIKDVVELCLRKEQAGSVCIHLLVWVSYSNKYCLAMGNKRLSYTVNFNLQALQYAVKEGKRPAGHKFDVNK